MKEFFGKFTFGFVMAQLAPGAIVVLSMTCPSGIDEKSTTVWGLCEQALRTWFESPSKIVGFLLLATGTGKLIHGLNWTILASLEEQGQPARKSFWHNYPIFFQLLLSPLKMIAEFVWVLCARGVEKLTMEENVPGVPPERMEAFNYLQGFYLNFGQFYSHTAYAVLISITPLTLAWAALGWYWRDVMLLVVAYFGASVFFLLGRVTLGSLFKAERELCED